MSAETIPTEFIQELPKTDLHVHLDGSIRIPTLIELAQEYNVELPSYTEGGLIETVFKPRYKNLPEYLRPFGYTVAVLQSELALERCAYELALDNQAEGVRYFEVRFAPQLHVHRHMNTVMVLRSVNRGLRRAKAEFNRRPEVVSGEQPPFEYGIICCAMRKFTAAYSEYFANLFQAHMYASPEYVFALASLEAARAAVLARDQYDLPMVAFDLAGEEAGYPAGDHAEAFRYAHKNFLKKTVHAGEAYGPESVFQAITDLHADRIGHGTTLLDPEMIRHSDIKDREEYIERLGGYIADRRITLEICLTSNLQTNPNLHDLSEHSFKEMRKQRLSTTICTDNRTVSHTSVTQELRRAVDYLGVSRNGLRSIIIYGFKRSFLRGAYLAKRAYVRRIIDYYDVVERKYFGDRDSGRAAEVSTPSEPTS